MNGKEMLCFLQGVQDSYKDQGLEEIIIGSYWDIEDVDDVLAETPLEGKLTRAQKIYVLNKAVDSAYSDEGVRECIWDYANEIVNKEKEKHEKSGKESDH